MATVRIRLPNDLVKWAVMEFRQKMEVKFEPTESQIITHALYQLKANITGEEYELPENYIDYKTKEK